MTGDRWFNGSMTMANQVIRPDLMEKLQEIARGENRSVNDILEMMIAQFLRTQDVWLGTLIEVLQDIARRQERSKKDVVEDDFAQLVHSVKLFLETMPLNRDAKRDVSRPTSDLAEQELLLRQDRLHLYELARRYWRKTGNMERAALTDEQLDEQFWLFDSEGIPRLKSEQGTITLQPNSLLKLAEAAEREGWRSGETDISERSREILNNEFADYLLARLNRPENQQDE
jgi:predicted transcriptional regulator